MIDKIHRVRLGELTLAHITCTHGLRDTIARLIVAESHLPLTRASLSTESVKKSNPDKKNEKSRVDVEGYCGKINVVEPLEFTADIILRNYFAYQDANLGRYLIYCTHSLTVIS